MSRNALLYLTGIFVFVALIWIYARTSDKADAEAGLAETTDTTAAGGEGH